MKFVPTLLLLASLGGVASAASPIVQTQSAAAFTASGTVPFNFNKFDTMGGTLTLTSVTLSFSFDKTGGSYTADNDSEVAGSITFNHELKGRLISTDVSVGTTGTYISALSEGTYELAANDGDNILTYDTGGSDFQLFEPASILATGHTATISPVSWAAYSGAGTFEVSFQASQSFGVDGLGGLQSLTTASQATPTVTVTYNYVPEPASALLGGLGLLTLLRRRRN